MKTDKTRIVELLKAAKGRGGVRKVCVGEAGRGQYNCEYSAPYEIRIGKDCIASVEESWSSPHSSNCYSYNSFISTAEEGTAVLLSSLPDAVKKWLKTLPEVDEAEELAESF